MSLTFIKNKIPVYFVGESHILSYTYMLPFHPRANQFFIPNIRFLDDLMASQYLEPNGAFAPALAKAFSGIGVIDPQQQVSNYARSERFSVLVLFAGDIDLHREIFAQLDQDYDYELPGQSLFPVDPARPGLPFAMMDARLTELLQPFLSTVRALVTGGIARLFIHALPPRITDAQRAASWMSDRVMSPALRAKVTLHANMILARACADMGAAFIDVFDAITEHGFLKPEYDLDGVHVTEAAAEVSFNAIIQRLIGQSST